MSDRRFAIGDRVLARWPGTTLYYQGEVEDFNDIEYLVAFQDEDQSKLAIKYKDVRRMADFRSRSRSRGRSPARSSKKSPARAAPKSPSRTATKSPKATSKSPGRKTTKSTAETSKASSKSSRSSSRSRSNAQNSSMNSTSSQKSSKSVLSNSTSVKEEAQKLLAPVRQSARIASLEKTNSYTSTTTTRNGAKSSDTKPTTSTTGCLVLCGISYFWSIFWPFAKTLPLVLFMAAFPLVTLQACTKKKCTIREFPDIPLKLESYFNLNAIYISAGALLVHFVLSLIPVKSRVLPNGAKNRGNGLLCAVLMLLAIPALVYFKIDINLPYILLRQMLATHLVLALIVSVALYVLSFYSPRSSLSSSLSGHFLPDFTYGREIMPRIASFDIKLFFFRHALITSAAYVILIGLREYKLTKGGAYNPTLFSLLALQFIASVDFVVFEDTFLTSYEYQKNGFGLLTALTFIPMPFVFPLYAHVISNAKVNLPWYCVCGCVFLYLIGYLITRLSTNQKHAFRTNPSSAALSHLETLPTSAGPRLLVSGWWGVVRHPNHAGYILLQVALTLLCGFSNGMPWLFLFFSVLSLVTRTYENESACKAKYGLSWDNYSAKVKYLLVPRIF